MKGLWRLICVATMAASVLMMLAWAGSNDYALLEKGVKPDGNGAMAVWAVVLMIPSAATLACKRIGEWYDVR